VRNHPEGMTVHGQVKTIFHEKKLCQTLTSKKLIEHTDLVGDRVVHSFLAVDMSFTLRAQSFSPVTSGATGNWMFYASRVRNAIRWATKAGVRYIILVCDRRSEYPQLRVDAAVTDRAVQRDKDKYESIDEFEDDDATFELSKLLNSRGGFTLAIRKMVQHLGKLQVSCILIDDRREPPIKIGNGEFPAYLPPDVPVNANWNGTPELNTSECDTLLWILARLHSVFYPEASRFICCKDGDNIILAAMHQDRDVHILWPNKDKFETFDMDGICDLFGRPILGVSDNKKAFDWRLAACRATLIYMAANDFSSLSYKGISAPALVTIALEHNDIPLFIDHQGRVDAFMLDEFMRRKRVSSINYHNRQPAQHDLFTGRPSKSVSSCVPSLFSMPRPGDATAAAAAASSAPKTTKKPAVSESRPSPAIASLADQERNRSVVTSAVCFVLYLSLFVDFDWPLRNNIFAKFGAPV